MSRQDTTEVNSSAAVRKGTNFYHSASYLGSMGAFKGMLGVAEEPETKPRTWMRDTEGAMITEMGTLLLGFPGSSENLSSQLSKQGWAHAGLLKGSWEWHSFCGLKQETPAKLHSPLTGVSSSLSQPALTERTAIIKRLER